MHLPRHVVSGSNPGLTRRSHAPLNVLSPPCGESSTVASPSPSRGGRLFADTCHSGVSELPAKDSIPLIRAASVGRFYLNLSTSKQLLFTQASTSVRGAPLGGSATIENGVDGVQLQSGRRLTEKSLKGAGGTLSLPPRLPAHTSLDSSPPTWDVIAEGFYGYVSSCRKKAKSKPVA